MQFSVKMFNVILLMMCIFSVRGNASSADDPQLPIGLNLMWINYYGPELMFNDLATTLGGWLTRDAGSYEWNTNRQDAFEWDENGYPLEVPVTVDETEVHVHAIFSNTYPAGNYVVLYDGEGEVHVTDPRNAGIEEISREPGRIVVYLSGNNFEAIEQKGSVNFGDLEIRSSTRDNHVRNLHIVPEHLEDCYQDSLFFEPYLKGLRPFHCLRFMQTQHTNGQHYDEETGTFGGQHSWSDRRTPTYFSQASSAIKGGPAIELLCALSNTVEADAWFCIPHMADDNYIKKFAETVKEHLNPALKVYIEYSNEVWNWAGSYPQSHWVVNNAPGMHDSLRSALEAIGEAGEMHPEKDAFMACRVFKIWESVFNGEDRKRLIRTVGVQHGWPGNTGRILKWLADNSPEGDPGCDMVSPGGYFGIGNYDDVTGETTAGQVMQWADDHFDEGPGANTLESGEYAKEYGIDYCVYEGGSHINNQTGDDTYDQLFIQVQREEEMYEMYRKNFSTHLDPRVDCKLFVAYAYTTGIFGHLHDPLELLDWEHARSDYPKWRALLDFNSQKKPLDAGRRMQDQEKRFERNFENGISVHSDELRITGCNSAQKYELIRPDGKVLIRYSEAPVNGEATLPMKSIAAGCYFLRITEGENVGIRRVLFAP